MMTRFFQNDNFNFLRYKFNITYDHTTLPVRQGGIHSYLTTVKTIKINKKIALTGEPDALNL